ncbi:MAG: hypothetical protein O7G84_13595 [Gammaproteobacteria bacterium]|nr:hypothetical protein [Gammaproteobacteria bacterium]
MPNDKKIRLTQAEMVQAVVDHLEAENPGYETDYVHFVRRPTGKYGIDARLVEKSETD